MKFPILCFLLGCFNAVRSEHFRVNDTHTGMACLLMNIHATFDLEYTNNDTKQFAPPFKIDGADIVNTSTCGYLAPFPKLSIRLFPSREYLNFTFFSSFNLVTMGVKFGLIPEKHFKQPASIRIIQMSDSQSLDIPNGDRRSYLCNSEKSMVLTGNHGYDRYVMTMRIKEFQVQAFNVTGNKFSPAIECSQDFSTASISPSYVTTENTSRTSNTPVSTEAPTATETFTTEIKTPVEPVTTPESHSVSTSEPLTTIVTNPITTTVPYPDTTTESKPDTTTEPKPDTTTETKPNTND